MGKPQKWRKISIRAGNSVWRKTRWRGKSTWKNRKRNGCRVTTRNCSGSSKRARKWPIIWRWPRKDWVRNSGFLSNSFFFFFNSELFQFFFCRSNASRPGSHERSPDQLPKTLQRKFKFRQQVCVCVLRHFFFLKGEFSRLWVLYRVAMKKNRISQMIREKQYYSC